MLNSGSAGGSKSSTKGEKRLTTDPLDDAMRELLDICQLYNDKLSFKQLQRNNNNNNNNNSGAKISETQQETKTNNHIGVNLCFKTNLKVPQQHPHLNIPAKKDQHRHNNNCDSNNIKQQNIHSNFDNNNVTTMANNTQQNIDNSLDNCSESIERLQQKQTELQSQLEEVLQVAKSLELKQKQRLNSIIEDIDHQSNAKNSQRTRLGSADDDEDDELIEFQQIENELRISELNRQLSNIQEELRLRLYKRLLTNTANSGKQQKSQPNQQISSSQNFFLRQGSSQTDEPTPTSSSCSGDQTTTSPTTSLSEPKLDYELIRTPKQVQSVANNTTTSATRRKNIENGSQDFLDEKSDYETIHGNIKNDSYLSNIRSNTSSVVRSEPDSAVGDNCEFLTPTTSKESIGSQPKKMVQCEVINNNMHASNSTNSNPAISFNTNQPICPSSLRNNSANSDLERIDEDEEDSPDYYSDSDRFRTIYEKKLSPIIQAGVLAEEWKFRLPSERMNPPSDDGQMDSSSEPPAGHQDDQQGYSVPKIGYSNAGFEEQSFNTEKNNRFDKKVNRPLTLYLPRADEEIDLFDHIQALGHDLDIISSDVTLDSTCAHGYLYKSCSNNNKKWLKRYFFFDRSLKVLSYYETKGQLVKRSCTPKNTIPFDEIGDVYVDHKLSLSSEKEGSSKRQNYVFVLDTTRRKYLLASARAETMRVWIDILFTAAKANDYFQELDADEDSTVFYDAMTSQ